MAHYRSPARALLLVGFCACSPPQPAPLTCAPSYPLSSGANRLAVEAFQGLYDLTLVQIARDSVEGRFHAELTLYLLTPPFIRVDTYDVRSLADGSVHQVADTSWPPMPLVGYATFDPPGPPFATSVLPASRDTARPGVLARLGSDGTLDMWIGTFTATSPAMDAPFRTVLQDSTGFRGWWSANRNEFSPRHGYFCATRRSPRAA